MAEDSYVDHRFYYEQIQSRFRAGVGRGVDLEQAAARVALAESNLTTETSNLHDVASRYLRVVGEVPMQKPPRPDSFGSGDAGPLPAMRWTWRCATARPSTQRSRTCARRAPRWASARARSGPRWRRACEPAAGSNFEAVPDQRREVIAGVSLNWNLFAGGADQARVRQQTSLLNQAADQRDRVCREARQNAGIAYNDVVKLEEQLRALDRNVLAIEKARDAYRQQFDIGQRSLLDLLNSENEVYTARRSYANADFDRLFAQARVLAAMQQLDAAPGSARTG